jgi:hypothetical protein
LKASEGFWITHIEVVARRRKRKKRKRKKKKRSR